MAAPTRATAVRICTLADAGQPPNSCATSWYCVTRRRRGRDVGVAKVSYHVPAASCKKDRRARGWVRQAGAAAGRALPPLPPLPSPPPPLHLLPICFSRLPLPELEVQRHQHVERPRARRNGRGRKCGARRDASQPQGLGHEQHDLADLESGKWGWGGGCGRAAGLPASRLPLAPAVTRRVRSRHPARLPPAATRPLRPLDRPH